MKKTKKQAKLYKIALSSLTIAATVGTTVGYGVNATVNGIENKKGPELSGKVSYSKDEVGKNKTPSLDEDQDIANPFAEEASDYAPDGTHSADPWYDDSKKYYVKRGTALVDKDFVTDVKDAEGYPPTDYEFDGDPLKIPPELAKGDPLDDSKWGWKYHPGTMNYESKYQQDSGEPTRSGGNQTLFRDSEGTLWLSANNKGMYKLEKGGTAWTLVPDLKFTAGYFRMIEDHEGTLWFMSGGGESLEYKKKGEDDWHSAGDFGFVGDPATRGIIFEDSSHKLWADGLGGMQYKNPGEDTWNKADSSCKLTVGTYGSMTEDPKTHYLWAMAEGSPLQYKKPNDPTWYDSSKDGNIITDGMLGALLVDSKGNVWAMGKGTGLQYKPANSNKWVNSKATSTDGYGGDIFEDSNGNIWIGGKGTPFQIKGAGTGTWGLNTYHTNAEGIRFFEDSAHVVWGIDGVSRPWSAKLADDTDSYDKVAAVWKSTLDRIPGYSAPYRTFSREPYGSIVEDKEAGVLYFTNTVTANKYGWNTYPQSNSALTYVVGSCSDEWWTQTYDGVEIPDVKALIDGKIVTRTKSPTGMDPKIKFELPDEVDLLNIMGQMKIDGKDYDHEKEEIVYTSKSTPIGGSKGEIVVTNYDPRSKLQYQKEGASGWLPVPADGIIPNLPKGMYKLRAISKAPGNGFAEEVVPEGIIVAGIKDQSGVGQHDGEIHLPKPSDPRIQLQFQKNGTNSWNDVPGDFVIRHLDPDSYKIRGVYKNRPSQILEYKTSMYVKGNLVVIATPPTHKDAHDGKITIRNVDPKSKMSYRELENTGPWIPIPPNGVALGLDPGEYNLKAEPATPNNGFAETIFPYPVKVPGTAPSLIPTPGPDGTIPPVALDPNMRLEYRKRGTNDEWAPMPDGVSPSELPDHNVYEFRGVNKNNSQWGMALPELIIGGNPDFIIVAPTIDGSEKGKIKASLYDPDGLGKIQYQKIGDVDWTDAPDDNIITGLDAGEYRIQSVAKTPNNGYVGKIAPCFAVVPKMSELPTTSPTDPKNATSLDGKIEVVDPTGSEVRLEWRKQGDSKWKEVKNGLIDKLGPGVYEFQGVQINNVVDENIIEYPDLTIIGGIPTVIAVAPKLDGSEKGKIQIKGPDPRFRVQWCKVGSIDWHNFDKDPDSPGNMIATNLDPGSYKLKTVPEGVASSFADKEIPGIIEIPKVNEVPTATSIDETSLGAKDGEITVTNHAKSGIDIKYHKEGWPLDRWDPVPPSWDITTLERGTYHLKGVDNNKPENRNNILYSEPIIVGGDPTVIAVAPTLDGLQQGKIRIEDKDPRVDIQWRKEGDTTWKPVPTGGVIPWLDSGRYWLKSVPNGTAKNIVEKLIPQPVDIPDLTKVPSATTTDETQPGDKDGTMKIIDPSGPDVEVRYHKVGWPDTQWPKIPPSGELKDLERGEYIFRGTVINNKAGQNTIEYTDSAIVGGDPSVVVVSPNLDGTKKGELKFTGVDHRFKIMYQKDGDKTWTEITIDDVNPSIGLVTGLEPGKYKLQSVPRFTGRGFVTKNLPDVYIPNIADGPKTLSIDETKPRENDGIIKVTFPTDPDIELRFRKTTWGPDDFREIPSNGEIKNLERGKYEFRGWYKSRPRGWKVIEYPDLTIVGGDPIVTVIAPTVDGSENGKIKIDRSTVDDRVEIKWQKLGENVWHKVPANYIISNLDPGSYRLLSTPIVATNGLKEKIIPGILVVPSLDDVPKLTSTDETKPDASDGTITVVAPKNKNITVWYHKIGTPENTWAPVPPTGIVKDRPYGEYEFKGIDLTKPKGQQTTKYNETVNVVRSPRIISVSPAVDGSEKGKIRIENPDPRVNFEWKRAGATTWTKVPTGGIVTNLDPGKYSLRSVPKIANNGIPTINLPNPVDIPKPNQIPTFVSTDTTQGLYNGKIVITNPGIPNINKFEYSKNYGAWQPIDSSGILANIGYGTYRIRGIDATKENGQNTVEYFEPIVIAGEPYITVIAPTTDGLQKGRIQLQPIPGIKFKYQRDGESGWHNVPLDGLIKDLDPGTYRIRMVPIDPKTGPTEKDISHLFTIPDAKDIAIGVPTDASGAHSRDGSIKFTFPTNKDIYAIRYNGRYDRYNGYPYISSVVTGLYPGAYYVLARDRTKPRARNNPSQNAYQDKVVYPQKIIVSYPPKIVATAPANDGSEKGKITITEEDTRFKVQYQKDGEKGWHDVPAGGVVSGLNPGEYWIQYAPKDTGRIPGDGFTEKRIPTPITIPTPSEIPKYVSTDETKASAKDGTIEVTRTKNRNIVLRYHKVGNPDTDWPVVPPNGHIGPLPPGEYQIAGFDSTKPNRRNQVIYSQKMIVGGSPTIIVIPPKNDGSEKAKIRITDVDSRFNMQWQKSTETSWHDAPADPDMPIDKLIEGLDPGLYRLKFVPKPEYAGRGLVEKVFPNLVKIPVSNEGPTVTSTNVSKPGEEDGKMNVINNNKDVVLEYQNVDDGIWKPIPAGGIIPDLKPGEYKFRGEDGSQPIGQKRILYPESVFIGGCLVVTVVAPTDDGSEKGKIRLKDIDPGYDMKWQINGDTKWTEVPDDNIIPELDPGSYRLKFVPKDPNNGLVEKELPTIMEIPASSKNPIVTSTNTSKFGADDGKIQIVNHYSKVTTFKYKGVDETDWHDVPANGIILDLEPGEYKLKGIMGTNPDGRKDIEYPDSVFVSGDPQVQIIATDPNTFKGGLIVDHVDPRAKVMYLKDGDTLWKEAPANGNILGLEPADYWIKLVPKEAGNGFVENKLSSKYNINAVPGIPTDPNIIIQYQLIGGDGTWFDAPDNGRTTRGMKPGEYKVRGKNINKPAGQNISIYLNTVLVYGDPTVTVKDPTAAGKSDGQIIVDYIEPGAKVQWQAVGSPIWNKTPSDGIIKGLASGKYKLRLVSLNGDSSYNEHELPDIYKVGGVYIEVKDITYETTDATGLGKTDGSIKITCFSERLAKLQYRKVDPTADPKDPWVGKNVPAPANPGDDFVTVENLEPGQYEFRWIGKDPADLFKNDRVTFFSDFVTVKTKIPVPTIVPSFSVDLVYENDKSSIKFTDYKSPNSKLQYQRIGESTWTDVPDDGVIKNLNPVPAKFRWKADEGLSYIGSIYNPSGPGGVPAGLNQVVKDSDTTIEIPTSMPSRIVNLPPSVKVTTTTPGEISVDVISSPGAILKYSRGEIDGQDNIIWEDVPAGKTITGISDEKVKFKWVVDDYSHVFIDGRIEIPVWESKLKDPNLQPLYEAMSPLFQGDSDGQVDIGGIVLPHSSKLQFSRDQTNWEDVSTGEDLGTNANGPILGRVSGQVSGKVYFRWVSLIDGEKYPNGDLAIDAGWALIPPSTRVRENGLKFEAKAPTYAKGDDGEILLTNYDANKDRTLQCRKVNNVNPGTWADVPNDGKIINCDAGVYEFRWHLNAGLNFGNNTPYKLAGSYRVPKAIYAPVPTAKPSITFETERYKGARDGSFTITNFEEEFSRIQYSLDEGKTWIELPDPDPVTGHIDVHNVNGKIEFQWVPNGTLKYKKGDNIPRILPIVIGNSDKLGPPKDPSFMASPLSAKGASDGEIEIKNELNPDFELQWKLQTDPDTSWTKVKENVDPTDASSSIGKLTKLPAGTYEFRWKTTTGEKFWTGLDTTPIAKVVKISDSGVVPQPTDPVMTAKPLSSLGATDGRIEIDTITDGNSKLQWKPDKSPDSAWQDVNANAGGGLVDKLGSGTYNFRWIPIDGTSVYPSSASEILLPDQIISDYKKIAKPADPHFTAHPVSAVGKLDGSIDITGYEDKDSKLQFSLDGLYWYDVVLGNVPNGLHITSNNPDELTIEDLREMTVQFKWVPIVANNQYLDGSSEKPLKDITIGNASLLKSPTIVVTFKTTSATPAGGDGSVTTNVFKDGAATLQYSTDGGANWVSMTSNTISGLDKGKVLFQWLAGTSGETFDNGQTTIAVGESQLFIPEKPTLTHNVPTTTTSGDGDITVTSAIPANVKLQWKPDGAPDSAWQDVIGNKIENLDDGIYVFQWVGINGEDFADDSKAIPAGQEEIEESGTISFNSIQYQAFAPSFKGKTDGKIVVKNFVKPFAHLEYKDATGIWQNVPSSGIVDNLAVGAHEFRWASEAGKTFAGGNTEISAGTRYVPESTVVPVPMNALSFDPKDPTTLNAGDGTIKITDAIDTFSKLQYTTDDLDGTETWHDPKIVGTEALIENLSPGDVHFQWVPKQTGDEYPGKVSAEDISDVVTINESKFIDRPSSAPVFKLNPLSSLTSNDGFIEIKNSSDPYSTLQYTTDDLDGTETWHKIPASGKIGPMGKTTVHFQWSAMVGKTYVDNGGGSTDTTISLADKQIDIKQRLDIPAKPKYDIMPALNGNDGAIQVIGNQNSDSILQYSKDNGASWDNVDLSGLINNLVPCTVKFRWIGINGEEYNDIAGNHPTEIDAGTVKVSDKPTINMPKMPDFDVTPLQVSGTATGKIEVKDFSSPDAVLYFTRDGGTIWEELKAGTTPSGVVITSAKPGEATIVGLSDGTVSFKWVANNGIFSNGTEEAHVADKVINDSKQISIPKQPVYTTTPATKGNVDGVALTDIFEDGDSKLQYTLNPSDPKSWLDVKADPMDSTSTRGAVNRLDQDSIVYFRWAPKVSGETYVGGDQTIDAGINGIQIPETIKFDSSEPSVIGGSDGELNIIGNVLNTNAVLKYKLSTDGIWKYVDTKNPKIENLKGGDVVQFQWVGKNGEIFTNQKTEVSLPDQTIGHSTNIAIHQAVFAAFGVSAKGKSDGHIEIDNFIKPTAKLQFKLIGVPGSIWQDVKADPLDKTKGLVDKLPTGMVRFQWVADTGKTFPNGDTEMFATEQYVEDSKNIEDPMVKPTFGPVTAPSISGNDDGTVTVKNFDDPYSKLQYTTDDITGSPVWTDVPTSGLIDSSLSSGDVVSYRWVGIYDDTYISNGTKEIVLPNKTTIPDSTNISVPTIDPIYSVTTAVINGGDGEVKVTDNIDPSGDSKLEYNDGKGWKDVPANGDISGLDTVSLDFRWVPKVSGNEYPNNSVSEDAGTTRIAIPTNRLSFTPHSPKAKSHADGSIEITDFVNPDAKLQYKLSTDTGWTNVLVDPSDPTKGLIENLRPGTYEFQWVGKLGQEFEDKTISKNAGDVKINESNFVDVPAQIKIDTVDPTYKGATDGEIEIHGIIDANSKLRYKKVGDTTWKDVPVNPLYPTRGLIGNLAEGDSYEFKWVTKGGATYIGTSNTETKAGKATISYASKIKIPTDVLSFNPLSPSFRDFGDGSIEVTGFVTNIYSKLQYKSMAAGITKWGDATMDPTDPTKAIIDKLDPGTYEFQWVGINGEDYVDGTKTQAVAKQVIVVDTIHITTPLDPVITIKPLSAVGAKDGEIHVKPYTDKYSMLQYKLSTETDADWKELPQTGLDLGSLGITTFNFRWIPINLNDRYVINGNEEKVIILTDRTIDDSALIAIPTDPKLTPISPSTSAVDDGSIKVRDFIDPSGKSKLKYVIGGVTKDVTGDIIDLAPGTVVEFKWVLNNPGDKFTNGIAESQVDVITISASTNVPVPITDPSFTGTDVSVNGGSDGSIGVKGYQDKYSELQYRKVTSMGTEPWGVVATNTIGGLPAGVYEFKWVPKSGTYPNGLAEIALSDVAIIGEPAPIAPVQSNTNQVQPVSAPTNPIDRIKLFVDSPSDKGEKDGSIVISESIKPGVKVQYLIKDGGTWTDVPSDGIIKDLGPGEIDFQYVPENTDKFIGGATSAPAGAIVVTPTDNLDVSARINADGTRDIVIDDYEDPSKQSELKYLDTSTGSKVWRDVPIGGILKDRDDKQITLKWVPKDQSIAPAEKPIVHIITNVPTKMVENNNPEVATSSLSSASVNYAQDMYHDFSIFRVSHSGDDVSEISYVDHLVSKPQLVESIEEATNAAPNEHISKLNMADHSTVYYVETEEDGKQVVYIEKISEQGYWLTSMKAVKTGDGTFDIYTESDADLADLGTLESEWEDGYTFDTLVGVTNPASSSSDEPVQDVSGIYNEFDSLDDDPGNPQPPVQHHSARGHHSWDKGPGAITPVHAEVKRVGDTIAVKYGDTDVEMSGSNVEGLSTIINIPETTPDDSSSFPWWTLAFAAIPVIGIIWLIAYRNKKSKKQ